MATRTEVESFLNMFRAKMEVFDIIFLDRDKNLRALIELEITRVSRKKILSELNVEDSFGGPQKMLTTGRTCGSLAGF